LFYKTKKIWHLLTKKERVIFSFFSTIGIISTLFLSYIYLDKITISVPVKGGKFVEGVVGQPVFINPIISGNNDVDRDLVSLVFCNLFEISDKIEKNGLSWHVRLKDNVFWHNGKRLTSDDVIFTINRIQDPDYKSPLSASWQGVIASRSSEREITFSLSAPFAFFEDNLKKLYVIPKHIFADIPLNNWRLSDYNLEPIGCGAFRFDSYQKKSDGFITKYILKTNENYFKRPPYIETLELNFYTSAENAAEDFNLAKINGLGNIDKKQSSLVRLNAKLFSLPSPRYYAIFYNQNSNIALKDKNVRLALDVAIDKDKIIKDVFDGFGNKMIGPVTSNFLPNLNESHSEKLPTSKTDPKDILENSGWKLIDNSFRKKIIGKQNIPLEFDLVVPEIPNLVETANIIQKNWQDIGIKTNLVILPPTDINNEIIKNRDYQMILFGNIIGTSPDLFSFWHSSQKFYPGLNLSLYENKTADKLIESIRKSQNESERTEDLSLLNSLIPEDLPASFLYSSRYLYLVSSFLKGFGDKLIVTPADRFSDITDWYIKTARKFK